MKPGAWLINVSRGGIVNEAALIEQLRSGHIGGAAIDVLQQEPPAADHPLLNSDIANLLITPHCAWGSQQSRARLLAQLVEILQAWLAATTLPNPVI